MLKCGSAGKCGEKLSHKHSRVIVASTTEILKLINKIRSSGSILGKKPFKKYHVLTEEIVYEIGTRLEYLP
jgi:hypothetical protein